MDEQTLKIMGEKTGWYESMKGISSSIEYKTFYLENHLGQYPDFDHEHCTLCFEKIMNRDGCEKEGYVTLDFYYWLCKDCYSKYHQYLSTKLLQEDSFKGLTIFEIMDTELRLFDGKYKYYLNRLKFFFNKIQHQPIKKVDVEIYPIVGTETPSTGYVMELRHRKVTLKEAGIGEILAYIEQIKNDQEVLNYASFNRYPEMEIVLQKPKSL
ncbi:hypothetical protein HMPREF9013_1059 [Bulleidia extructa W1219]|uniref:Uncharacterized protein n=1 Tax=Bulleidia extructa W1219 TaxID=679192 RepID=D2MMS5_9FIRM|nr:hypothetical protein [Bulleidia extructa]EFC06351.1 hypothetical protein HMPREF9013_1059 [Bulleidia extructa W1219]